MLSWSEHLSSGQSVSSGLSKDLLSHWQTDGKCISTFIHKALDFSDDEKEKEAKQRKKSQIQGRKKLKSELNESGECIVILQSFLTFMYSR